MKHIKQRVAVLLAVLLMIPTEPVLAAQVTPTTIYEEKGKDSPITEVVDEVSFNTGNCKYSVVSKEDFFDNELGDAFFEDDGSFTINIPEENPFFPYEVQFTCNGEVTNQWFMTPDDSVEIGGHTFYVSAYFDDTVVTQMSLNVAGDVVTVYPEEKEFIDGNGAMELSLLPLDEVHLSVALTGYTPTELTMVSIAEIFTGDKALKNTDKVMWVYETYDDDYTISSSGDKIDMSYQTQYGSNQYEMIVGDDDQLAADNIRYIVNVEVTQSEDWLVPTVCTQDDKGSRTDITVSKSYYYDYGMKYLYIYTPSDEFGDATQAYVSLRLNDFVFDNVKYSSLKIYDGQFDSVSEAMSSTDITDKIWSADMTEKDAGYVLQKNESKWITIVTFDSLGNATGCMSIRLRLYVTGNNVSVDSLYYKSGYITRWVRDSVAREYKDGCYYITQTLYKGYAADDIYYLSMDYSEAGISCPDKVTAAYVGQYSKIAEAQSAGANDIKEALFGDEGYASNYSQGVYFTIFVGADGSEQEVYLYCVKAEEGDELSSSTYVTFYNLKDNNGSYVPAYVVNSREDSYGEYNYVSILVDKDVNLHALAPVFSVAEGVNLYATGSSSPEISGESVHDFSNGSVQYTASAEDGTHLKNYWLQIVKAEENIGKLYINSLADSESNTRVEDGVIYSTREVMMDEYHSNIHDIFLANMGTEDIAALSVELVSNTVELDEYWTLSGDYDLSGFKGTTKDTYYGGLSNLAKIRIKAMDGIENGTDVSGTLTIKSGNDNLMVLTLTGTIGNPCITTKEIPQAVKYVPYGTMIQNNNKYSWNEVSYKLTSGKLPNGMEVKPNGELYGVPTETGEFTFTVRMSNSSDYFSDSIMTYTLVVVENTDENVEAATDQGYDLIERVQDMTLGEEFDQTLVSTGTYAEFVAVYLDGVKLEEGTDYDSEEGSTRITIRGQTLTSSDSEGTHTLGIEFRTDDTELLMRAAQNYDILSGDDTDDEDSNDGDDDNSDDNSGSTDDETDNDNVDSDSGDSTDDETDVESSDSNSTNNEATNTTNSSNSVNNEVSKSENNASDTNNSEVNSDNGNVTADSNTKDEASVDINASTTVQYTITAGDSLWKIAEKYYGSGSYWERIFKDNAATISNPEKIYVGQVIVINLSQNDTAISDTPASDSGSGTSAIVGNTYMVQSGDTLWKIANKVYGRGWLWREIYKANADIIADPGHIYEGQIIKIPEI